MDERYDIVIVGAGIIGLATARALHLERPKLRLAVIDKEADLGRHQTGRNSGVLHSGIYYTPGSLKAQLCIRGKQAMERYAGERGIPFREIGKVIVATDEREFERLDKLRSYAVANGVAGLRELHKDEIASVEPHVCGIRALHAPHTGVIDYRAVLAALAEDLRTCGGEVLLGNEVVTVRESARGAVVQLPDREISADGVISCAGLQSDRLARRSGADVRTRIVPFRGDYYTLTEAAAELVHGLVYPVPDPRFPFLGVHFTRKIDGTVVAGPNAVLALAREGYRRLSFNVRDSASALGFPGVWRFAVRHGRTAATELWRDISKRAFVADMARYVPAIGADDVSFGPVGIRAQAMRADGTLVDDFVIEGGARTMHVLNAPSPGATASLAIGEELAHRALRDLIA